MNRRRLDLEALEAFPTAFSALPDGWLASLPGETIAAADIAVLEHFLPPAATAEEIDAAVTAAIAESGATSAKDMGKVMKAVMPKLAGKNADGKAVNEAVRRKLGAA